MRATGCGALMLLGLLGACGSGSDNHGMKISCSRGGSVQPVNRVEMRVEPTGAALIYRDPLSKDVTSTMRVAAGDSCVIAPTASVP